MPSRGPAMPARPTGSMPPAPSCWLRRMRCGRASRRIQALGGAGYTKEWPVERFLRDAKLYDIGAGTQRNPPFPDRPGAHRAHDAYRRMRGSTPSWRAELRRRVAARGAWRSRKRSARATLTRGKLLPRERVNRLLDPGSPFLGDRRSWPHSASTMTRRRARASSPASAACPGREVMIVANDATVKGGAYFPLTVKKHLRAQEIARQNRLPCVYLVDSGGANLPLSGRSVPRPRSFRAHLLQPGADVAPRVSRRSRA